MPLPSKKLLGRLRRSADRVEQTDGEPRQRGRRGASAEPQTARVTSGTADGNGNYPAVITAWDGSAWQDYGAVKVKAANGETLTSGTRYSVAPVGTPSGSDPVFVTTMNGGGTSGGITVREVDLSPDLAGISYVEFDQTDGFVVTSSAAATARVDLAPANTTTKGALDVAEQWFVGRKKIGADKLSFFETTASSTSDRADMYLVDSAANSGEFFVAECYGSSAGKVGIAEFVWAVGTNNYFDFQIAGEGTNNLLPRITLKEGGGTVYNGATSGADSGASGGAAGSTGPLGFFGGIFYGGALFTNAAPGSTGAAGYTNQMHCDGSFFYFYVNGTGWVRAAVATF